MDSYISQMYLQKSECHELGSDISFKAANHYYTHLHKKIQEKINDIYGG